MKKTLILVCINVFIHFSCKVRPTTQYFGDANSTSSYITNNLVDSIRPKDVLDIQLKALNSEKSLAMFSKNEGTLYEVDSKGMIHFPGLGTLKVAGKSIETLRDTIQRSVSTYANDAIVNIRYYNFQVTVIGRANAKKNISIPDGRMNLIQALAEAGDLQDDGSMMVRVFRSNEEGAYNVGFIDLSTSQAFQSPYFNLKQNDVVIVDPDKEKWIRKQKAERYNQVAPYIIGGVSITNTLLILINYFK